MALSMSGKMTSILHRNASRLLHLIRTDLCIHKQTYCVASAKCSEDKGKLFFRGDVQRLLKSITGFNLDKIFKEKLTKIRPPRYQLLTDTELEEIQNEAIRRGRKRLQMPPVLEPQSLDEVVISNDPEIEGHDENNLVFTDITYGIKDKSRTIAIREPNGKLRLADYDERNRLLNVYFPTPGRMYYTPQMFKEPHIEHLLREGKYEYILDRATVQFEPDESQYTELCHKTYDHLASHDRFDDLRSTRHFGPMVFYFVYHNKVEGMMVDMLQRSLVNDATDIVKLHNIMHPDTKSAKLRQSKLDVSPEVMIQEFADNDLKRGGVVQLALQSYLESKEPARDAV